MRRSSRDLSEAKVVLRQHENFHNSAMKRVFPRRLFETKISLKETSFRYEKICSLGGWLHLKPSSSDIAVVFLEEAVFSYELQLLCPISRFIYFLIHKLKLIGYWCLCWLRTCSTNSCCLYSRFLRRWRFERDFTNLVRLGHCRSHTVKSDR